MRDITPCRPRWNGTMTDRERFNAQLHYKPVDRSFNMEFGYWDENFAEWSIFTENGIKNNEEADVFFNFDKIVTIGGATFMSPPFKQETIGEEGDKRLIRNGDGLIAEVPKDGHDTIPHYLKSSIETPEDWEKVKAEHFNLSDPGYKVDIESLKARFGGDRDYPLGINTGSMIGKVRDMLTFEGLCYAYYDYPEMVEDMVETSCVIVENQLDQILPHFQFDYAAGWEDICFKNGPILPPSYFREVIAPRYKRIHKKLAAAGIDIWYLDCDGDVRPIMPIFLDCGINCLFPFEVNGCAHPGELLNEYKGQLRIMGGVDKIQLKAGKEAIDRYLATLEPLVAAGGYIPFCDHRCPPDVSVENYLYYLDRKQQLFGMK